MNVVASSTGGGSSSGSDNNPHGGRTVLPSSSATVPVAGGQVLGISTGPESCAAYSLKGIIRPGANNDSAQVLRLQEFLNAFQGSGLALTGVYDQPTIAAVIAFQTKYADRILSPWGVSKPTGNVYFTTIKTINELSCGFAKEFPLTAAQLAEIARVKALEANGGIPPVSNGQGENNNPVAPKNPENGEGSTTPIIGSNASSSTATAGVGNAPAPQGGWFSGFWHWVTGR